MLSTRERKKYKKEILKYLSCWLLKFYLEINTKGDFKSWTPEDIGKEKNGMIAVSQYHTDCLQLKLGKTYSFTEAFYIKTMILV